MKHLANYSLLFTSLLAVFNASATTETSGGTITFTGQVADTTCTINCASPAELTIALDLIAVSDCAAWPI